MRSEEEINEDLNFCKEVIIFLIKSLPLEKIKELKDSLSSDNLKNILDNIIVDSTEIDFTRV